MAGTGEMKIKAGVSPTFAALAEPGDTILIGFDRTLSDDELNDLREGFQDFTETTGVHIAFVEHATSMVVARGRRLDVNGAPLRRRETLEGNEVEGER